MKLQSATLVFILISCLACAQPSDKELSKKIDDIAKDMSKPGDPGFTVAVAKGDQILFSKG